MATKEAKLDFEIAQRQPDGSSSARRQEIAAEGFAIKIEAERKRAERIQDAATAVFIDARELGLSDVMAEGARRYALLKHPENQPINGVRPVFGDVFTNAIN